MSSYRSPQHLPFARRCCQSDLGIPTVTIERLLSKQGTDMGLQSGALGFLGELPPGRGCRFYFIERARSPPLSDEADARRRLTKARQIGPAKGSSGVRLARLLDRIRDGGPLQYVDRGLIGRRKSRPD